MPVDITLEDPRWEALDLHALAQRAIDTVLVRLGLDPELCDISLLACDDGRIAALNGAFRQKDAPTNVLSWPTQMLAPETPGALPPPPQPDFDGELGLGDIAIAYETCQSEADVAGKSLSDHVTHLIVHGLLHLLGYDHIVPQDAERMENLETEILGILNIADPYRLD